MAPTSCRHLSFTLISATDLPDVRIFGDMKVYAEISLRTAKTLRQTSVDKVNGTNPKFNTNLLFLLPQSVIEQDPGHILDVELYCKRTFSDNKYVGQVNINLKRLFESSIKDTLTMAVKVGDFTSTQGTIEFSYSFGDLVTADVVEEKEKEKSFAKVVVEEAASFAVEFVISVLGA